MVMDVERYDSRVSGEWMRRRWCEWKAVINSGNPKRCVCKRKRPGARCLQCYFGRRFTWLHNFHSRWILSCFGVKDKKSTQSIDKHEVKRVTSPGHSE